MYLAGRIFVRNCSLIPRNGKAKQPCIRNDQ